MKSSLKAFILLLMVILSVEILHWNLGNDTHQLDKYLYNPREGGSEGENATILLNGNAALDAFCAGNGTDGLTVQSAHVIKDLILAAGDYTHALAILNTNRYLTLVNLTLVNSTRPGGAGLYLKSVSHLNVSGCLSKNNYYGILLVNSNASQMEGNTFRNNSVGVNLYYSNSTRILNSNFINNTGVGIGLSDSCYNNITANNVHYNGSGKGISLLGECCHNVFTGNLISECEYGYYVLWYSNANEFLSNTVTNNTFGIFISNSDYHKISQNNISNNRYIGIWLQSADFNTITDNILLDNPQCMYFEWWGLEQWRSFINWNFIWGNEGCSVLSIPGNGLWVILGCGAGLFVLIMLYRRHRFRRSA